MTRRPLLTCLAVVAVAAVGCAAGEAGPARPGGTATPAPPTATVSSPPPSPTPSAPPSTPAPSPTPLAGPPAVEATWAPASTEVEVEAKQLASVVALHLTTHDPDGTAADRAATVPTGAGDAPLDPASVLAAAEALHRDGAWSRSRVTYPQLGGLTEDATSIMVVTEQRWQGADALEGIPPQVQVRTIDVRLRRTDGAPWQLAGVASVGGEPVDAPAPSPDAEALLADERVRMPDSARWDVLDGTTDPALVALLLRIAERAEVGVITLRSGHPVNVFETDRVSHHTLGRAVDIHTVAGVEVVAQREEGSPAHDLVRWLYEQPEVVSIGSPWALDGFGGRSFTDPVHQDHIHVAVRASDG